MEFVLIDSFSQFARVLRELSILVIGGTFAYSAMVEASSLAHHITIAES